MIQQEEADAGFGYTHILEPDTQKESFTKQAWAKIYQCT